MPPSPPIQAVFQSSLSGDPRRVGAAVDTAGRAAASMSTPDVPVDLRTGWLYDLVAAGMRAYTGARFDVRTFHTDRLCLEPRTLYVSTHRSDDDVPLLCGALYFAARLWRRRHVRAAFAVRDDLFEPGFFAGYPQRVPLPVRRVSWPLAIGGTLRGRLGCLPIRSATSMRLVQVLRAAPELPLDALPADCVDAIRLRADALGRSTPSTARELLRPEYADLLWRVVGNHELDVPELAPVWRRRAGAALDDLRTLVAVARAGGRLLIFPEGRPSPDGEIGPLMPGCSALVRRGGIRRVQPIALAYDALAPGRRRAYVSVGEPFAPPRNGLEDTLLDALRRAMPLTSGQLAALAAREGGRVPPQALAAALERARAEARPVEPELVAPGAGSRLAAAVTAARAAPDAAARLAREARSAGSA